MKFLRGRQNSRLPHESDDDQGAQIPTQERHRFPARPANTLTRTIMSAPFAALLKLGPPRASNTAYVRWLRRESMLATADQLAKQYSGHASMWRNPYAHPRPLDAVRQADVWFTAYPISHLTNGGQSILAALGDDMLWQYFETIGIKAIHTGPVKQAGGIDGWQPTPSVDGYFDRISMNIDPAFGTASEFRNLSNTAARHNGIVIDDIIPGHTGKGADFRLAEMGYAEYPGIYHMIEINPEDWGLLPDVPEGGDSVNLDKKSELVLKRHGYIIGELSRVIFYEKGVKETNWSATRVVRGVDGVRRRWVYLHYFKEGQPTLNWIDPSFAGMRLVIGDALHSIGELGSKGLRLDANGFLGVETRGDGLPAWSEGHPLSPAANLLIAGMVRKLGGFTFQELNLTFEDIKASSDTGADLSYDFINRPAYHHALVTGDTEFLRLTLREALKLGIQPASLVHALQNHDDLTYELVHFWTAHKSDRYPFRGKTVSGEELRHMVRTELQEMLTGPRAPYNLRFTENGIACTTASVIAAALGKRDLASITDDDVARITGVHLLLAMFNAWQPGVFALSGWDLVGALPLDPALVGDLVKDGDTRWINRGAYDLLGNAGQAALSLGGIPPSRSLYGALPEQLGRPMSFASRLQRILAVRKESGMATAEQLEIAEVSAKQILAMVHQLPNGHMQLTVLNFGPKAFAGRVHSEHFVPKQMVLDVMTDEMLGIVNNRHELDVPVAPYSGRFLVLGDR